MCHEQATYFTSAARILTVVGHITQHPSIFINPAMYIWSAPARFFVAKSVSPTHLLLNKAGNLFLLRSIYYSSTDIRYKSYVGCITPVVILFNKDASCCSGVCVHCKLFHLSIIPSAAPPTGPTGSS